MIKFLTQARTLWLLFALLIVELVVFIAISMNGGFPILDAMSDPSKIECHIKAMTDANLHDHILMTATLDVALPLTYGALFAGLALKVLRPLFALPSVMAIPVDLTEGVVQIMTLKGRTDVLWLKAYVTPLKFALSGLAAVIAIYAVAQLWKARPKR